MFGVQHLGCLGQGGALLRQATVPAASQPPPASGSKSGHPLVLGAENAGSVVQQRPLAAAQPAPSDAAASKKRRRPLASALDSTDAALPNGAIADEAGSGDEEDGAARESTLGERVAALRVADSAAPLADAVQPAEDGTITADSLSVLLTQVHRIFWALSFCFRYRYKQSPKFRAKLCVGSMTIVSVCLVGAAQRGQKPAGALPQHL